MGGTLVHSTMDGYLQGNDGDNYSNEFHFAEVPKVFKKRKKNYQGFSRKNKGEKVRQHNVANEDRARLVSEAIQKMKGKIPEIASSHVSSRVLQTCIKYCSQPERDAVFEEFQPHLLTLACNTYAVHLVKKLLDNASKKQLGGFISLLHGHVAIFLRHMVGSVVVVVEHAYHLANATQKPAEKFQADGDADRNMVLGSCKELANICCP